MGTVLLQAYIALAALSLASWAEDWCGSVSPKCEPVQVEDSVLQDTILRAEALGSVVLPKFISDMLKAPGH